MPQMSPMNWFNLFMNFNFILLVFITFIYFMNDYTYKFKNHNNMLYFKQMW